MNAEEHSQLQDSVIAGITVAVAGEAITAAFAEPGHLSLPLTKTPAGFVVTLPRLDTHAMIVFEE